MSININKNTCVGCGICVSVCPFGALSMAEEKAIVNDACTSCGACVDQCPVKAINLEKVRSESKIDKGLYKGVWVFVEHVDGNIRSVVHELIGQGKIIADKLGEELSAIVFGGDINLISKEVIASGVDKVYHVNTEEYLHYNSDVYTINFVDLISKYKPNVILMGATVDGRDLAPRVACKVNTGLTADCTSIDIDEETNLVAWTRPAFGGNIMATILCPDYRPQMGTVRPNVFKRPKQDFTRSGEIIEVKNIVKSKDIRTKLIKVIKQSIASVNLKEAQIICAGGRGMGNVENFKLIEEFAEIIGGAVAASRAVVDAGWKPALHQVGQTGKTVAPKVYFAFGISGAIQHVAGMSTPDIIIAINKDPNAPIFKYSNYGIIADAVEFLPVLIAEVKKMR